MLQLGAKPGDMDINCSGVEEETIAPYALDEFLAAECPPLLRSQHPQQLKLLPTQLDLPVVDFDLKADTVDAEGFKLYDTRRRIGFHGHPIQGRSGPAYRLHSLPCTSGGEPITYV